MDLIRYISSLRKQSHFLQCVQLCHSEHPHGFHLALGDFLTFAIFLLHLMYSTQVNSDTWRLYLTGWHDGDIILNALVKSVAGNLDVNHPVRLHRLINMQGSYLTPFKTANVFTDFHSMDSSYRDALFPEELWASPTDAYDALN